MPLCRRCAIVALASTACVPLSGALAAFTNNIMITGYWPPTSFMLRSFSTSPTQNPGGWQGGNFQNSGFNVYSYFPEFPGQTGPNWGRGVGDFEVDYQDTWDDFERITSEIRPLAIITFSRANTSVGWELEPAAQRFRVSGEVNPPGRSVPFYTSDGFDNNGAAAPNMNFPTTPEFLAEPVGTVRQNTLPMQNIVDAVASQMTAAQASPFIAAYNPGTPDTYDYGGSFLSGYISYLGLRYKDLHSAENDPFRVFAAGHIHVGLNMTVANGEMATRITLETLIEHLNTVVPAPSTGLMALSAGVVGCRRRRRS